MKSLYLQVSKLLKMIWRHFFSAGFVGICCGFYSYTLLFQSTVFSKKYLLFAIIIAFFGFILGLLILQKHSFAKKNNYFINGKSIKIAFILWGLALPSMFFIPSYPALPFFQHWSSLAIELKTLDNPIMLSQLKKTWLRTGLEPAGFEEFSISSNWIPLGEDFILYPNSTGSIKWEGYVGSRATLSLPIPTETLKMSTNWDGEIREVDLSKPTYFRNKDFIPNYLYILLMNSLIVIPVFFIFIIVEDFSRLRFWVLVALIISFSLAQVRFQFDALGSEFETTTEDAIQTIQLQRHNDVLKGIAANPWQFRVLSEWIIEFFFLVLGSKGNVTSVTFALKSLRIIQNLILLFLAYQYFLKLGNSKSSSIYGVFILAVSMLHIFYDSDLSFNTYFDVIFYLIGAIIILDSHYIWLPILMIFAALNRETSGMIPVLFIFFAIQNVDSKRKKAIVYGLVSLCVWVVIFIGLRLFYPNTPIYKIGGILSPGLEYVKYNLSIPRLPILLFQTFGLLPIAGWFQRKKWHSFIRLGVIILVPVWLFVHFFTSVWAETRLFLVLIVVVIIPTVLPLVNQFSVQLNKGFMQYQK